MQSLPRLENSIGLLVIIEILSFRQKNHTTLKNKDEYFGSEATLYFLLYLRHYIPVLADKRKLEQFLLSLINFN